MKYIHIDKLGRIVIPIGFRRKLDLYEGSPLEIFLDGEQIIVRRPTGCCKLCYTNIDVDLGSGLCKSCIDRIKNM
jgi:transcriptional pleiotropic regulator of transition state genes